jgi:adenylosuccinate synthase
MSKDLFQLMREQEIQTSNFLPNKLEIQLSAKTFIKDLLDAGETDKFELLAQAKRMGEALEVINAELLKVLPQENFEGYGLKGTFRSGGETINYKDCEVWNDINRELKEREELLKLALKSQNEIYDAAGVQVPKVSTTPRKSSMAISF